MFFNFYSFFNVIRLLTLLISVKFFKTLFKNEKYHTFVVENNSKVDNIINLLIGDQFILLVLVSKILRKIKNLYIWHASLYNYHINSLTIFVFQFAI